LKEEKEYSQSDRSKFTRLYHGFSSLLRLFFVNRVTRKILRVKSDIKYI